MGNGGSSFQERLKQRAAEKAAEKAAAAAAAKKKAAAYSRAATADEVSNMYGTSDTTEDTVDYSDQYQKLATIPTTIPTIDSTTPGRWSFGRDGEWLTRYPNCSNNQARIAPLNIDTAQVSPCNALCRFSINYVPTTCSVSMVSNIPTIRFGPG